MGRIYASQGEQPEMPDVAAALDEFYQPRFARDAIAAGKVGQVLAIAERIDTLPGIVAVGSSHDDLPACLGLRSHEMR